jgi:very-short-patch-repair endonuclease
MTLSTSREDLSFAEHRLWSRLSSLQMDRLEFRRKAVVGPHVADFLCLEAKLVIEVDGPLGDSQVEAEFTRQRYFETLGLRVLRFTEGQVLENLEWVLGAIQVAGVRHPAGKAIRSQFTTEGSR